MLPLQQTLRNTWIHIDTHVHTHAHAPRHSRASTSSMRTSLLTADNLQPVSRDRKLFPPAFVHFVCVLTWWVSTNRRCCCCVWFGNNDSVWLSTATCEMHYSAVAVSEPRLHYSATWPKFIRTGILTNCGKFNRFPTVSQLLYFLWMMPMSTPPQTSTHVCPGWGETSWKSRGK